MILGLYNKGYHRAPSEDSDQTVGMRNMIPVITGRKFEDVLFTVSPFL